MAKKPIIQIACHDNDDKYMPTKAHEGDACFDLVAREVTHKLVFIKDLELSRPVVEVTVKLGIYTVIPEGYEARVNARSSIKKTGLILSNCTGIIDAPYRGEWMLVFYDFTRTYSDATPAFKPGDRVAQYRLFELLGEKQEKITMDELLAQQTERGNGGFGSTGQ